MIYENNLQFFKFKKNKLLSLKILLLPRKSYININ